MPAPTLAVVVVGLSLAALLWCMFANNTEQRQQHSRQGYGHNRLNNVDDSTERSNSTINQYEDAECTICKDSIAEEDSMVVMSCSHMFHSPCIEKWFTVATMRTCPNCRRTD